jgi:hypothetical protein
MTTREHVVTMVAALIIAVATGAIALLLTGERGGLRFLGWVTTMMVVSYPSLLMAMRSASRDPCTAWLKRIAAGASDRG